jgi:HEAT repeat protein
MELLGPPRRSEAALAGLLAVPAELRVGTIFQRLDEADHQETLILLSLLPPLRDHERIVRLVPYLADADEAVRGAAAEALARAPAAEALPLLASELDREGVAPEVIRALGGLGEEACAALTPLLMDPVPGVRVAAARALSRCAGRAIEGQLRKAYATESDGEARQGLLLALGRSVGGRALDLLEEALASESVDDRLAAIEALGLTGDDEAVPYLEAALSGSPAEALAALHALGDLGRPGVGPILERHLTDESLDVRRTAARAALKVPDAVGARGVEAMTRDPDAWIRSCGARLLATRGEAGRERLAVMAETDPDPQVRRRARRGLDGGD